MQPFQHPQFNQHLERFYPHLCTIKERKEEKDEWGEPKDTWGTKDEHEDIQAARGQTNSAPQDGQQEEYSRFNYSIILNGYYPDIKEGMKAEITEANSNEGNNTEEYIIKAVDHDLLNNRTRLISEVVRR